jgi:SPP1 gp7 family putative phage head morphogenesis protein
MKINLDSVFNLEPEQAVGFFADKGLKPSFDWRDMVGQEHDTAFTVAKMMDNDLLETTQGLLKQAIKDGQSFGSFKEQLIPKLVEKGWWGRAEMLDPLTGMVSEVQLGSVSRLETVFRTNLQSAYSAGKWESIERNAKTSPYLMYVAVDDNRTREEHARFDELVLRWDNPFWKTHYPPNGWNCRCGVIQLSELEVKEMGLKVATNPPPIKQSKWINPRTGKTHTILDGTDPGWNHNPGLMREDTLRQDYLDKINALPEHMKQSAIKGDALMHRLIKNTRKIETGGIIKNMNTHVITRQQGVLFSTQRTDWAQSKHDGFIHAQEELVKAHPHYLAAKGGSFEHAVDLSAEFLDIEGIERRYKNPILLPITAEEKLGKNAIPLGMAALIQAQTKWGVENGIYQSNKAGHTGANGWHRLVSHATFEGEVVLGGHYVILDDFLGMGGTLASLKSFIEGAGAKVVGYEILTGKLESSKLYLRKQTLNDLREKHGQFEAEFKQLVGFDYSGLSESEARYLLRAKSIERLRNQITRAIFERYGEQDEPR